MMTLTIVHSDLYLQTFPNSVVKWNICVSFRFRVREIDTVRKVSKYGVFSGPYFPAFGLNTGKYGLEKTPYLDTFHTVYIILITFTLFLKVKKNLKAFSNKRVMNV